MQRGEMWWASLAAPAGRRQVLLLTRNAAYAVRTAVTVAPITRTIRSIPVEVPVGLEDGMPVPCVVNLDDVMTVAKTRLLDRITILSNEKMESVAEAIAFALDLRR